MCAAAKVSFTYLTNIFLPALMYIPGRTVFGFTRLPCRKAQAPFCDDIFSANIYLHNQHAISGIIANFAVADRLVEAPVWG